MEALSNEAGEEDSYFSFSSVWIRRVRHALALYLVQPYCLSRCICILSTCSAWVCPRYMLDLTCYVSGVQSYELSHKVEYEYVC